MSTPLSEAALDAIAGVQRRQHPSASSTTESPNPSVSVKVPPPSRLSTGDSSEAVADQSTHSTTNTLRWSWWRLYVLSPTTVLDLGQATYDSVYPRLLSLEYIIPTIILITVSVHGAWVLSLFCYRNSYHYISELRQPPPQLVSLGSIGYDDKTDQQWTGFTIQYRRFISVAALLGVVTAAVRRCTVVEGDDTDETVVGSSRSDAHVRVSSAAPQREQHNSDRARRSPSPPPALRGVRRLAAPLAALRCWCCCCGPIRARRWWLPSFYCIVGVIFVAIVHGPHFFMPLLLALANYVVFSRLQRWCSYRVFLVTMWTTHISLLYLIELYQGFEATYWLQYYFPTSRVVSQRILGEEMARDALWRQRMRWCVAFRMTTLRLIAFNYDLWEATHGATRARQRAADKHDTTCVECAQLREQNSAATAAAEASRCYKYRTEHPRDLADYSLVNYLAYIVFPPLYLAGPMSSFNAFVSYMRVPSAAASWRNVLFYAFGTLRIYLTEVVLLSFVHVTAIGRHPRIVLKMNLVEKAYYLFYTLAYLWLKFSFIWKSSRLFALFSGIEVPEDMRRCFANSFSVRDFWRDWHASFNLWIVRYMYIPMGGRPRVALSILPIFLFIALWHDPALHLVKWALCIAAMFVAELAVSACFGWACGVVQREMAEASGSRGDDDDGDDGCGSGRESGRGARSGGGGGGGVAAAVLLRLARLSARRLSPRVRAWCYRMLRVVGGTCTVFGLIVANLVGFSMQNSAATFAKVGGTTAETEADRFISRALQSLTLSFGVGMALFLGSGAAVAVMDRDMAAHRTRWLKEKLGLR